MFNWFKLIKENVSLASQELSQSSNPWIFTTRQFIKLVSEVVQKMVFEK